MVPGIGSYAYWVNMNLLVGSEDDVSHVLYNTYCSAEIQEKTTSELIEVPFQKFLVSLGSLFLGLDTGNIF